MASGYADAVNGTALTEVYLDDNLMKQAVLKYASAATRTADASLTAALREGMVSYQDDTNCLYVYSGSTWSTIGPVHATSVSWNPTWTQSAAISKSVALGGYWRMGRQISAWCYLIASSAGTSSNTLLLTLPVTAAAGSGLFVGTGYLDKSGGNRNPGFAILQSTTTVAMSCTTVGLPANTLFGSGANAFTTAVASGDIWSMTLMYEAAADA